MARKKSVNYFELLSEMGEYTLKASELLYTALSSFDKNSLEKNIEAMHNIEHTCDIKKHEILRRLAKEFITPIECEDIIELTEYIDNVTDSIEDVLRKVYVYNIDSIKQEACEFAETIVACCKNMLSILSEFGNFRKSKTIHSKIVSLDSLEETGDRIYFEAMSRLFRSGENAVSLMVWHDIYETLEKCCDSAEDVALSVSGIIMKNT